MQIPLSLDCDLDAQVRTAEKSLRRGQPVELHLRFRGREMAHSELGFDLVQQALFRLSTSGRVDAKPKVDRPQHPCSTFTDKMKSPNKAPEPTTFAGTSRAIEGLVEMKQQNPKRGAARAAPAKVVAHL